MLQNNYVYTAAAELDRQGLCYDMDFLVIVARVNVYSWIASRLSATLCQVLFEPEHQLQRLNL